MFEKGERIVCNTDFYKDIKYEQICTVIDYILLNNGYLVLNLQNIGSIGVGYRKDDFISLSQHRYNKLKKIINRMNVRKENIN